MRSTTPFLLSVTSVLLLGVMASVACSAGNDRPTGSSATGPGGSPGTTSSGSSSSGSPGGGPLDDGGLSDARADGGADGAGPPIEFGCRAPIAFGTNVAFTWPTERALATVLNDLAYGLQPPPVAFAFLASSSPAPAPPNVLMSAPAMAANGLGFAVTGMPLTPVASDLDGAHAFNATQANAYIRLAAGPGAPGAMSSTLVRLTNVYMHGFVSPECETIDFAVTALIAPGTLLYPLGGGVFRVDDFAPDRDGGMGGNPGIAVNFLVRGTSVDFDYSTVR